jgi:hypothetical protein
MAVWSQGNDKQVAMLAGLLEVPDMTKVEQIENAVAEDDPPSLLAKRFENACKLLERVQFDFHVLLSLSRSVGMAWRGVPDGP